MRKKSGVEPDSLSNDRKSVLMKKKMKMKKKLNTSLGGLKTLKQMSRKKYLKVENQMTLASISSH